MQYILIQYNLISNLELQSYSQMTTLKGKKLAFVLMLRYKIVSYYQGHSLP